MSQLWDIYYYLCAIMNRQKIIDCAIATLNHDFHASLEKIAAAAHLNRRTLHRYFKDRDTLLEACWIDMLSLWETSVLEARASGVDDISQLKNMFFAGIENGVKYAFLIKLYRIYQQDNRLKTPQTPAYEQARDSWFNLVPNLQEQGIINQQLSKNWIQLLFTQVIIAAIESIQSGSNAMEEIKTMAWYSFSQGIGIKNNEI